MEKVEYKGGVQCLIPFDKDDNLVERSRFVKFIDDKKFIKKLEALQLLTLDKPNKKETIKRRLVLEQKEYKDFHYMAKRNSIYVNEWYESGSLATGVSIGETTGIVVLGTHTLANIGLFLVIVGHNIERIMTDVLSFDDKNGKYDITEMVVEDMSFKNTTELCIDNDIRSINLRITNVHYIKRAVCMKDLVLENFKRIGYVSNSENKVRCRKMEAITIPDSRIDKAEVNKIELWNINLTIGELTTKNSGDVKIFCDNNSKLTVESVLQNTWTLVIRTGGEIDIKKFLGDKVIINLGEVEEKTFKTPIKLKMYSNLEYISKIGGGSYVNGHHKEVMIELKFYRDYKVPEIREWLRKYVEIIGVGIRHIDLNIDINYEFGGHAGTTMLKMGQYVKYSRY